jgi:DNA polymerase-3 subunit alpha
MAVAGAFDCFKEVHRAQYFFPENSDEPNLIEKSIRYANTATANSLANQQSLFGGVSTVQLAEPTIQPCETWSLMEKLRKEKEVIGMYLSGHPLDDFKIEMTYFNITPIQKVEDMKGKEMNIAGIVTDVFEKMGKNNKPYANFTIEDYSGNIKITMWSEEYLKFKHLITIGQILFLKGSSRPRFQSTELYEYKPSQMMLLAEVREKLLQKVTLTVKSSAIKNGFTESFKSILEQYKGNALVKFYIKDEELGLAVLASSRKYRINLENELVKRLEDMGIEYKLN